MAGTYDALYLGVMRRVFDLSLSLSLLFFSFYWPRMIEQEPQRKFYSARVAVPTSNTHVLTANTFCCVCLGSTAKLHKIPHIIYAVRKLIYCCKRELWYNTFRKSVVLIWNRHSENSCTSWETSRDPFLIDWPERNGEKRGRRGHAATLYPPSVRTESGVTWSYRRTGSYMWYVIYTRTRS